MPNEKIKFRARIDHVTWFKESWGAISVTTEENIPHSKEGGSYDFETNSTKTIYRTTLTGKMPTPEVGLVWNVEAHYIYHTKYKDQYVIDNVEFELPKTLEDSRSYLQALLSPTQADTLLSVYPNIVNEIIAGTDNVDLKLLNGFGQITYDRCKEKIIENFAISDILGLLIPLGISYNKIKKLLDGESNPLILKEKLIQNPYKLTEINGISFATADKIATQLNPSLKESEFRLIAFIKYTLEKIGDSDGHSYITKKQLKSEVIKVISVCEKFLEPLFEKELENPRFLHMEGDKIGLLYYYKIEEYIYNAINQINDSNPLKILQENIEKGIELSESQQGFPFSEQQKNILYEMINNNLNILSGFGGSGKSSLSRGILNIYGNAGYKIGVCALSAKAAKRASETTGFMGVTTHRLLESDSFIFNKNEENKLEFDVILVDEASMKNSYVFSALLKAINTSNTKLILVGDHFQLPPIQFGQVFTDLLTIENKFQKNVLTEIHRTSKDSGIFIDAMKMRKGENPLTPLEMTKTKVIHGAEKDMIYMFSDSKEYLHNIAINSYLKAVEENGIENVVILSPRKNDTLNSTRQFNFEIQHALNKHEPDLKFEFGKKKFFINDRVIQTRNDKDKGIYNGYTGRVEGISSDRMTSIFDDSITTFHTKEDIQDIELANAISCHRSQGSEYGWVIVVLDMDSYMLLSSELFYTARTRGKTKVLVLAQPKAYLACLNESEKKRNTWFKEMLINGISS